VTKGDAAFAGNSAAFKNVDYLTKDATNDWGPNCNKCNFASRKLVKVLNLLIIKIACFKFLILKT